METGQPSSFPTTGILHRGLFGSSIPATVAFAVALFLFLLPFAELKCNHTSLARNTGLGIAIGSRWQEQMPNDIFRDNARKGSSTAFNAKRTDPNMYALVALIFVVVGLACSFINSRIAATVGIASGIASAASLIGLLLDLKNEVRTPDLNAFRHPESTTDFNARISLVFTPWFYIALISLLAAAVLSWLRLNTKTRSAVEATP